MRTSGSRRLYAALLRRAATRGAGGNGLYVGGDIREPVQYLDGPHFINDAVLANMASFNAIWGVRKVLASSNGNKFVNDDDKVDRIYVLSQ